MRASFDFAPFHPTPTTCQTLALFLPTGFLSLILPIKPVRRSLSMLASTSSFFVSFKGRSPLFLLLPFLPLPLYSLLCQHRYHPSYQLMDTVRSLLYIKRTEEGLLLPPSSEGGKEPWHSFSPFADFPFLFLASQSPRHHDRAVRSSFGCSS